MANRLVRFSTGLHINIPHHSRREHHDPSAIEGSTNYISNHQDSHHQEMEQLEHRVANTNPVNIGSHVRVISDHDEPMQEEEAPIQKNSCLQCLEYTIAPAIKLYNYLKSNGRITNILNNLRDAGIAKLNSDQAYNVKKSIGKIKTLHEEFVGRNEKLAKPLTREIQPKNNNHSRVLHVSFCKPSMPLNPESETEILDPTDIDFIELFGIEDSIEDLSTENIALINIRMNQILKRIASGPYGFIAVNCEAGIFRSGSFILTLLILKQHLSLESGITQEHMVNIFVENYQQCVGLCRPTFKGIANRKLLNALIRALNAWAIENYIYRREIPLVGNGLANKVDEEVSKKLRLKFSTSAKISGVIK